MRAALCDAAQSIPAPQPAPARSTPGGAGDQLESSAPFAQSLHASAGATPPAQQGDGGHRTRTLRFYLGALTHAALLPRAIYSYLKEKVRGEQPLNNPKEGTTARRAQYKHKPTRKRI